MYIYTHIHMCMNVLYMCIYIYIHIYACWFIKVIIIKLHIYIYIYILSFMICETVCIHDLRNCMLI